MRSLLVVGSECHSGVAFLYFDAFPASLTLSFALVKSAVNYLLKNLFFRVASSLKRVVQFLHFILSLGIKNEQLVTFADPLLALDRVKKGRVAV